LYGFLKYCLAHFIIPILATGYSHTFKTIIFFWRHNIKFIVGLIKGIITKYSKKLRE